jgi:hypothetical protein
MDIMSLISLANFLTIMMALLFPDYLTFGVLFLILAQQFVFF